MTKFLISLATLAIFMVSCNNMQKTAGGLEYKIFHTNGGSKISVGDYVFFKVIGKAGDSVLFNTYKNEQPPYMVMPVQENFKKGNFEEGLTLLGSGDSALFKINADSFYSVIVHAATPKFIKKGQAIEFYIKIDSFVTRKALEERKAQSDLAMAETQKNETTAIEAYAASSGLKYTKTESGLYYSITKATNGPKASKGEQVETNYTGKLLNGKVFDTNAKTGKPFAFVLGAQQVIMGWDEIFSILHEGEKATIILPSSLAYGAQGAGADIEPYASLVFDVELLKVNKSK